jgi:hypothetical protein
VELEVQEEGLILLCEVLERAGIPHLLSGGTLLGAARDGDFIRWDWDVEVSVRSEDVEDRMDELVERFSSAGLVLRSRDDAAENLKLVLTRGGAVYELQAYRRRGARRVRRDFGTLQRFFDGPGMVTLRGREYACMGPVDEYLTHRYGDWRTPKRTAVKSDYLASGYFRRPAWWRTGVMLVRAVRARVAGARTDRRER